MSYLTFAAGIGDLNRMFCPRTQATQQTLHTQIPGCIAPQTKKNIDAIEPQ